ncbi:ABC transporter permease [Fodinicola feengrottensis]|uniref:ABC transporter permease n=1 Tax=Fodinicola feengrottensis TaxID=435914 RepID=UPI0024424BB6|nr:ABC transporter permease [Fodinicola feengrottensis]
MRTATLSRVLYRKPLLRLGSLLSLPLLWLVIAYLGSLAAMFLTAFWTVDAFTGNPVPGFSLGNFGSLFSDPTYLAVAARSLGVAAGVTVIDAIIALPLAFFMAKVASPRAQRFLVAAVLTPLWASYLVKAYAWRVMLGGSGVLDWMIGGGSQSYYGLTATTVTLAYLWLPYMILPVYAGLERIPNSLIEASSDLGASAWRTFRSVILPLLFPAVVAGSIFTFSLTLGDYITVKIVGGKSQLFANVIYDNVVTADNLPFAAAAGLFPVAVP